MRGVATTRPMRRQHLHLHYDPSRILNFHWRHPLCLFALSVLVFLVCDAPSCHREQTPGHHPAHGSDFFDEDDGGLAFLPTEKKVVRQKIGVDVAHEIARPLAVPVEPPRLVLFVVVRVCDRPLWAKYSRRLCRP